MPRSFPRRRHTPAEPEKPFEALAEQAKQARTQFFVYLATVSFLLVTVLSITDKQLLLNNYLVTLPLISVSVPPLYVLILGPALLLITFCNLHIHWFRYLKEVQTLGLTPQAEQRKLFPLMIYQALYHPHQERVVRYLESNLAKQALSGFLLLVQSYFVWTIMKFHVFSGSVAGLFVLVISAVLKFYWDEKNSITLVRWKDRFFAFAVFLIVALVGFECTDALKPKLTVNYELLSPPLELLDTPIVTPFLERLNREASDEADKTKTPTAETHDVFDGVYWLDLRSKSLAWANLEGSILLKTNFERACLEHAQLNNTDLRYSNLKDATLNHADLVGAKLNNAYLERAELNHAYLERAELNHADLWGAQLNNADLEGTELKGVYFDVKLDEHNNLIPAYGVGGENLCQAKTLEYAQMDDWLFKKLKTIKACNGKLKGVNTPPPE